MKRIISSILALMMLLSVTACNSSGTNSAAPAAASAGSAETTSTDTVPTIDQINLGTDYKDIKADLKFLTHKTDIVDTVFADYVKEFQKMYPNINITYEGITDYEKELGTRITTKDWGDICMIPAFLSANKKDLGTYFLPLGDQKTLANTYRYTDLWMYDGKSYGLASNGNIVGIIYNKRVWKEAGITTLPKTPDEFLEDLQKIKDKYSDGSVVPLYTNFAAKWTMTAWDAYISSGATGSADYLNVTMPHAKNPFSKQSDMTGPYAVYYTLYESVKRGLTEKDPTTTDWESSKPKINKGEIATMALGSWAITQCQDAGPNKDDIGYMPFPITVNGKQYAMNGGDYNYGINVTSSKENQIASMLYIKWLVEKSGFAQSQGCISTLLSDPLPAILEDSFKGVELLVDSPAKAGEESLVGQINSDSELSLNGDPTHVCQIVEEAGKKDGKTLDQIMDEWNQRWTKAQQKNNA
jgi:raffinose/stachyose/melibiose transport system substrate-binding protein